MEPEHVLNWGQAILYVGGGLALTSWSVGNLFSKMTSGYGGIITALQRQNGEQQKQLDDNKAQINALEASNARCVEKHEDCDKKQEAQAKKIEDLEKGREEDKKSIDGLKKEIDDLKDRTRVAAMAEAMKDVGKKIDQVIDQTKPA